MTEGDDRSEFLPIVRTLAISSLIFLGFGPMLVAPLRKDSIVGMLIFVPILLLAVANLGLDLARMIRERRSR